MPFQIHKRHHQSNFDHTKRHAAGEESHRERFNISHPPSYRKYPLTYLQRAIELDPADHIGVLQGMKLSHGVGPFDLSNPTSTTNQVMIEIDASYSFSTLELILPLFFCYKLLLSYDYVDVSLALIGTT